MSRGSVRSSAAFVSPHVKLVVREGKDKTRNRTRVKSTKSVVCLSTWRQQELMDVSRQQSSLTPRFAVKKIFLYSLLLKAFSQFTQEIHFHMSFRSH